MSNDELKVCNHLDYLFIYLLSQVVTHIVYHITQIHSALKFEFRTSYKLKSGIALGTCTMENDPDQMRIINLQINTLQ